MSEWKVKTLGELVKFNPENLGKHYPFEKIHYIDISSVGTGDVEYNEEIQLSEAPSRAKRLVSKNDTILATVRPVNKSYYYFRDLPENLVVSTGFAVIRPIEEILDGRFLYYLISNNSFTSFLVANEQGANYPAVTPDIIGRAEVLLPTLLTQKRIASILSAYDDLIDNNLKRIKLLEELAQRTYEEWFLKFRVNGVQLDVGENGLPERWEKKRLEECIVNFDNKRKPLAKMVREERKGNYPYYGAAGIIDYLDDFIFTGRHLLIGEDGTVITPKGNAVLQFVEGKFWVSNHAHVVIGKDYFSTEFIYCFLNKYPISQHITGAAQPKISQSNLNRIETIVANRELMILFQDKILPVINQIFNLKKQNLLLKESRDILLPRLMSGKIGVGEVLGMVAEGNNEYSSKSK